MRRWLEKFRCECSCVFRYPAVLGLGAFLCAVGGILLWVNGGSGWFVIHKQGGGEGELSLLFFLWFFVYALYGIRLSVYWIIEGRRGWCSAGALCGFAAVLAAYLFDLAWYAVFFCTRLTVFAILLLFAAVCLNVLSVLAFRRRFFITAITALPVIGAEIFSICRTVSIFLLN